MSPDLKRFLLSEKFSGLSSIVKLEALLWWHGVHSTNSNGRVSFKQLRDEIQGVNHPQISNNLGSILVRRKGIIHDKESGHYYLDVSRSQELRKEYGDILASTPKTSSTLLDTTEFENTRAYVEKVVRQVNVSYDESLFDCCSIMIRRLVETLIIEAFEKKKVATEIKRDNGDYKVLSDILSILKDGNAIGISRPSKNIPILKKFKDEVADQSAHNRTFIAKKNNIDNIWEDLEAIILELKSLAFD